jgi:hypothetical protein
VETKGRVDQQEARHGQLLGTADERAQQVVDDDKVGALGGELGCERFR